MSLSSIPLLTPPSGAETPIAYPSLLSCSTSIHQRARKASLVYMLAGWIGSAMGIGMGQHLRAVPLPFVALAATLILGPALVRLVRSHRHESAVVIAGLGVSFCLHLTIKAFSQPDPSIATVSVIERGHQVYIAEGYINCHSQYVRPNTTDVLLWGPSATIDQLRTQHPPLIGNRRQGPDLSQVGGRRSSLWLKAHFFNPTEGSHASFMPSYAHLFGNSTRGDDLVQYLSTLKSSEYSKHVALEQAWEPSASAISQARANEGAHLYRTHCATCHEAEGATRRAWASSFKRLPPDLRPDLPKTRWLHVPASDSSQDRIRRLAQIIKFGIPETDMPGHEYLSDQDISSLALWLNQPMVAPRQFASIRYTPSIRYILGEPR